MKRILRAADFVVETELTDQRAAELCLKSGNDFGAKLAAELRRGFRLSETQLAWLHRVALDTQRNQAADAKRDEDGSTVKAVYLMGIFSRAAEGEKYPPKLTFMLADGLVEFRYTIAGRNPNTLWVTNGQKYGTAGAVVYGSITLAGKVKTFDSCPDWVTEAIRELIDAPEEFTQRIAEETDTCPGCGMSAGGEMHERCADRFGFG